MAGPPTRLVILDNIWRRGFSPIPLSCPLPPSFFPVLSMGCSQDIATLAETEVIFSFKSGAGVAQHPSSNRGASTVNFATGEAESADECHENFAKLHGAFMLFAWMVLVPWGIYYVRCRPGFPLLIWSATSEYKTGSSPVLCAGRPGGLVGILVTS